MRILLGIVLIFLLSSVCSLAVSPEKKRLATRKVLENIHEKQKNVGLSAAVYHKGKLVFSEGIGFADLEFKVPVSKNTKFQIASVTKAFTGAALIKLAGEGKIGLNQDIREYVPGFPKKSASPITPKLLAIHLAGIRHYRSGEKNLKFLNTHYQDLTEAVRLFSGDDLIAEPGTKYNYSSYGYNLLALAIQNAAGNSFDKYVGEQIFRPLGLENTEFNDVRFVSENRTRHYSFFDPISYRPSDKLRRVPDFDYSYNMGGGNILSTAEDLAKFGQAFIHEGFFTEKQLALIYQRPRSESPWSYGWFVPENPGKTGRRLHITGAFSGAQASLYVYPDEELSIAVLANTWGLGSNSGEMVEVPKEIFEIWK